QDAADGEQRNVERLEDHQQRQDAEPDDRELQIARGRGRHSTIAMKIVAHARTAFPSAAKTWVCARSGMRWSASPVRTFFSRGTTTRMSPPVLVRAWMSVSAPMG